MAETPANNVNSTPSGFAARAQGHRLHFLVSGEERLKGLLGLIDSARSDLQLCYYIVVDDAAGRQLRDALLRAVGRGVAVSLLVDGFGSSGSDHLLLPLRESGAKVEVFSPRWSRRYLIRNHQKFAIADGSRAMLGGFNIADAYFASPVEDGWADLGVEIEGPVVADLRLWFDQLMEWVGDPRAQWRAMRRRIRNWQPGTGSVRLLLGGPTRVLNSWAQSVKRDLETATRLDIMTAYFSPSPGMIRRIRKVAGKGPARLVLAGKSDNAATIGASRLLYRRLLECGVGLWEYGASKLHAKLLVVDDAVYVGSANFDMRSLFLNLELMLRIEDAELAGRVRRLIDDHAQGSLAVTPQWYRARSTVWNRMRWTLSWFLVAVLDYTVARRLNLGL